MVDVELGVELGALERREDGTQTGLRGHTRHAVGGRVDGISTRLSARNHGGHTGTSGVVGVDVDGKVRVTLADRADQQGGGLGLEDTGHILDTQSVGAQLDDLVDQFQVVVQVVLLLGVQHVSAVADGGLDHTASGLHGLDTDLELVDIVEGVEDTEDVDTVLLCLLAEVVDGIVRQRRVGNAVGSSEQHLEGDVGDQLPELAKTVPGVLVEETHGDIEGGTTPALQGIGVGQRVTGLLGNVDQVDRTHTGGQQRLVSITPGGVHDETALVGAHCLGEGLRTLAVDDLLPASGAGLGHVDEFAGIVVQLGEDDLALEFRLTDLTLDAAAIDSQVTQVGQQLLGTVLAADQGKQLRGVVDEGGPAGAFNESWVAQQRGQEGNVSLDTTDTELHQGTQHLAARNLVGGSQTGTLDQHGVIVRSDDGTGKAVSTVQTDTVTTSGTVDLDLTGVRGEALGRILGGDTALDGETTSRDALLRQAQLLERGTGSNLDLGGDDINTRDLFGDGVLDLDTGVDLDEVVAVLLVDQELGGTSVAVVDGASQLDGIRQDLVADGGGQVLGRGQLDHLLVTTLDGAVTLEQVDDVALAVTQQLDLDVLGLVEEALDEDGAVSKGALGLGGGTLKGIAQVSLVANNAHTTATTTKGSLDNDGEAIGIGEVLDLFVPLHGALRSGHDGDAALDGQLTGGHLVTQGLDGFRGRAHEDDTGLLDLAGELCVLGEESVTGVDQLDAVLEGDLDNLVSGQIGAHGGVLTALSNHVGLVRLLTVHGQAVLVRVDGDGLQGQLVGGTEDTDGDFTTVGDEDLLELHDGGIGAQTPVDRVLDGGMAVILDEFGIVDGLLRLGVVGGHDGQGGRSTPDTQLRLNSQRRRRGRQWRSCRERRGGQVQTKRKKRTEEGNNESTGPGGILPAGTGTTRRRLRRGRNRLRNQLHAAQDAVR